MTPLTRPDPESRRHKLLPAVRVASHGNVAILDRPPLATIGIPLAASVLPKTATQLVTQAAPVPSTMDTLCAAEETSTMPQMNSRLAPAACATIAEADVAKLATE